MFIGNLDVRVDIEGEIRTLLAPLRYVNKERGIDIEISTGSTTNYGSVPMFLQNIIPASGRATYAYVLHDKLYELGIFTRAESDLILKEAMKELGCKSWRIFLVHKGLQIGGGKAWKKCRQEGN